MQLLNQLHNNIASYLRILFATEERHSNKTFCAVMHVILYFSNRAVMHAVLRNKSSHVCSYVHDHKLREN